MLKRVKSWLIIKENTIPDTFFMLLIDIDWFFNIFFDVTLLRSDFKCTCQTTIGQRFSFYSLFSFFFDRLNYFFFVLRHRIDGVTSNLTPIRWAFSFLYSSSTSKSISFSFLTLASRSSRSASTFDFSNSYCFSAFAWPTERQNSSTSLSTIKKIRKQYESYCMIRSIISFINKLYFGRA